MAVATQLRDDIDEILPGVVADRRDFHQHPELAFQEVRTAGIVAGILTGLRIAEYAGAALSISSDPLTRGPLTIQDRGITHDDIVWDPRIGIRVGTDKMWRATVKGHRSVSGRRPAGAPT